jgi:hypothetical protein
MRRPVDDLNLKPTSQGKIVMAVQSPDTPRNRGDEDAPHYSSTLPSEDARTVLLNQISWGAVFAGVVVSLAAQLILNMLGVGIGASTIDPLDGGSPSAQSLGIGAGLWWTVSGIIAAFVGGHVAGRLAGKPRESTTAWHGLVAWAMATLIVFYLLTTALGGVIGGAYRTVAGAVGGAAQAAGPVIDRLDPFAQIERAMRSTSGGDQAALDAAVAAMQAAVTGDEAQAQAARERSAEAISRARNIPIEQARKQVQSYEQQYRQRAGEAKQQATEVADAAAAAVTRGALFGALALILGAVAGWFGGRSGKVEPTLTSPRIR